MVTPANTRTYTASTRSSGPPSSGGGGSQVRVAFRKNGAPNSSNMLSDDPPYEEGEESDEEKLWKINRQIIMMMCGESYYELAIITLNLSVWLNQYDFVSYCVENAYTILLLYTNEWKNFLLNK